MNLARLCPSFLTQITLFPPMLPRHPIPPPDPTLSSRGSPKHAMTSVHIGRVAWRHALLAWSRRMVSRPEDYDCALTSRISW